MDTGQVWVWDIEREARVRWLQVADGFVESLTFSPDGRLLMAGATDGKVTIWPTDEGLANAAVIDVGREAGNSVVAAFRDEGRHIVTIPR